jgi:hypothetical protein
VAQPLQHIAAVELAERFSVGQLGHEHLTQPDLDRQLAMRLVDDLQVMLQLGAGVELPVGLRAVQIGLHCRLPRTDNELCARVFLSKNAALFARSTLSAA